MAKKGHSRERRREIYVYFSAARMIALEKQLAALHSLPRLSQPETKTNQFSYRSNFLPKMKLFQAHTHNHLLFFSLTMKGGDIL